MSVIDIRHLTRDYRGVKALDDVTFTVRENSITGLLGRNGAGKSTLMRILAGFEFPTSGSVTVFGQTPTENDAVLRRMAVVRESRSYPDIQFRRVVEAASWFYPNWNQELADLLIEDFALPRKKAIKKFSRGMMSAAGIVVGLAARAEVTILDEPYAGLDAVARQMFYDRLLADYAEHPRTVVLSTHLIDEIGDLLEDVLVIDRGRMIMAGPVDALRGSAVTVTGKADDVLGFAAGQQILSRETLAGRARVMLAGPLEAADRERAERLGLTIEPVSLQQLVVSSSLGIDRGKVAS